MPPRRAGGWTGRHREASQRSDSAALPSASNTIRADSVVLRTDKARYRAGEKVTLTFENKSASSYTFNPARGRWSARAVGVDDGAGDNRICTMEAWILEPHDAVRRYELPATMAPGRYRVVVRMSMETSRGTSAAVSAISDPITVS
jgi:predicted acyl esterase